MNYLNNYNIIKVLGSGAFGVVTLRYNATKKHTIACKEFINTRYIHSWDREVSFLKSIRHENIIMMYDSISVYGRHYIFLEYIDMDLGYYIYNYMSPSHRISRYHIAKISVSIARALNYCHKKSIVHRDIKPSNIMLNKKLSTIKLIDFGVARVNCSSNHCTPNVGTLNYRSPELLLGIIYDVDVDIWALGCVISEMYLKQPPFFGATMDVYGQITDIVSKLGKPRDGVLYNYITHSYPLAFHATHKELIPQKYTMPIGDRLLLMKLFQWDTHQRTSLKEILKYYSNSMRVLLDSRKPNTLSMSPR